MKVLGYILLLVAVCLTLGQVLVYGKRLPEKVASHFGGDGVADGWMSRGGFLMLYVGLQIGTAAFLALMAWAVPRLPVSMINLPNREYWLDETRRPGTIGILQGIMILLAGITALFLVFMFQATIQANLQQEVRLNDVTVWSALGIYLVMVFGTCVWMIWRFSRVPADD